MISTKAPRNLFEFDNARYLSSEEIVETFLPTKAFWRLLSAKNHVVLGARGSGKTAIARMLAHPQLAKFREPRARKIVASKSFIGLYVPTKAEWIGGLRNKPWLSDAQKERLFAWRMNVATCLASLATLRSCLDTYVEDEIERLRLERALASRLAADWFPDEREVTSLGRLKFLLEDIEFKKHQELAAGYTQLGSNGASELGLPFHVELFLPLRRAIRHASEILDFPDTTIWLLCLDEAEALEEFHQRILNSYLRTHSDNLVFKLTTTPYGHYTLETNVGADLSVGNDFEYIYIDRDFVTGATERGHEPTYEARLFRLRAKHSGQKIKHISLRDLLGRSPLLSPIESGQITREELITEIRRSGDQLLKRRTELLSDSPNRFNNEIARKLAGIVLLRAAVSRLSGQEEIDLYAGSSLVVRCSDGNPRRMIRLFNKLILEGNWTTGKRGTRVHVNAVSPRRQTQLVRAFSVSTLARVQAEPGYGRNLHSLLSLIGRYMRALLHDGPLSTDHVTSVVISPEEDPEVWPLVKAGVGIGLLYPNIHPKKPDELPEAGGTFHFAYVLTPAFYLMPRRGKARKLATILEVTSGKEAGLQLTLQLGSRAK